LLCQSAYVDVVAVESFRNVIFFGLGGFFLSLCFCGVLDLDHLLFLLCFLGSVSTQCGGDGGSGEG